MEIPFQHIARKHGYELHVEDEDGYMEILVQRPKNDGKETVAFFRISEQLWYDGDRIEEEKKFTTLLWNNIWPPREAALDAEGLQQFIDQHYPSEDPRDKLLRVLQLLHSLTDYDGERISYDEYFRLQEERWRKAYVRNEDELRYYIETLQKKGLVEYDINDASVRYFPKLRITTDGLSEIMTEREKQESRNCFVAMSFHAELIPIYDQAIAPAIVESGFVPVLIRDHKDIPSDQTINDAILAAIKKSRFTIVDFTHHRAGVYFEAGYALGRGQKVIYTCRADELEKAHFDTRNYPHIAWHTAADLKRQLMDKIEVFINV